MGCTCPKTFLCNYKTMFVHLVVVAFLTSSIGATATTAEPTTTTTEPNICGNENIDSRLNLEQTIQYPGYPSSAGSYLECSYSVRSPNGTRIRFSFESFGITTFGSSFSIACYDKTNSSNNFLLLNRQNQEGLIFHSESNVMVMKLRVRRSYNYTGFRFETTAVGICDSRYEAYEDAQPLLSPGYPFKHSANQHCLWNIVARPNHVIKLTANQTANESCCIHFKINGNKIAVNKGSVFQSSGNKLEIEFFSKNSIKRNPFLFYYRSEHVCGMNQFHATNLPQTFQTPTFSGLSSRYLYCKYNIIAPKGSRIRFQVEVFRSYYTYLYFYDGSCESNEIFLILRNNNQKSKVFHSKSNVMVIKLRIYYPNNNRGFSMSYQAVASCGSDLIATEAPQVISSPGYPKTHPANLVCTWIISAPSKRVIVLNIKYLNQEKCCAYLETVSFRPYVQSRKLNGSLTYRSSRSKIEVNFVSQNSLIRSGFQLEYTHDSVCGKTVYTAEINVEKDLKPPTFPVSGSSWMYCWYTITAPKSTKILFLVESMGHSRFYRYTYLWFYNSLEQKGRYFLYLNRYSRIGKMHHSKSNYLGIKLQTYRYDYYKGFHIRYTAVESCGINILATNAPKTISTPIYRSNLFCSWTILTSSNHLIEVVTKFVSNDTCCESAQITQPSKIQLKSNQTYTSTTTSLTVDFLSQNSSQSKGFVFQVRSVAVCGVSVYKAELDKQSIINPPGFAGSSQSRSCWYSITAPIHTRILFWVDSFGNSYKSKRWYHFYMNFYNGLERSGNRFLHLYHYHRTGVMYQSSHNYLGIYLYVYNHWNYTGFKMRYMAVDSCGGNFRASSSYQTISTPNYPAQYKSHLACTWKITPPRYHLIEYKTSHVSNDTCCEIFTTNNGLRLNSNQTFVTGASHGNNIMFNFVSFNSTAKRGFKLQFKTIDVCGKKDYTATLDEVDLLQLPSFPLHRNYYSTSCWYTITAPLYKRIRFWIDKKTVSRYYYYHSLRFSFYNNLEPTGNRFLYMYLGYHQTRKYHSESNYLGIKLDAHVYRNYYNRKNPNFNLSYMAVDSCGRSLAASSSIYQKLSIPGYPEQYNSNLTCVWKISTSYHYLVKINIVNIASDTSSEYTVINSPYYKQLQQNKTYYSSRNTMTIAFCSHNISNGKGIDIEYKAVSVCGERSLTAEVDVQKIFTSPGYLGYRWHHLRCWYTITAPSQTIIQFYVRHFRNRYSHHYYKYIQFFNRLKQTGNSFLLLRYVYKHNGKIYHSESNYLGFYIYGYSYYWRGFEMRFKAVESCGSNLIASENYQTISTPGYPHSYNSNLSCTWTITTTNKYFIKLKTLSVSNDTCCEKLKMASPKAIMLNSNQIYDTYSKSVSFHFFSNKSSQMKGFQLVYKAEPVCGNKVEMKAETNIKKQFYVPIYPTYYYNRWLSCWYTVTAPTDSRIKFSFRTKYYYYTRNLYLKFYDGFSNNFLRFYRRPSSSRNYYSVSDSMSFYLQIYKYERYTGLSMTYEAIDSCKKVLDAFDQPQVLNSYGNASNGIYQWLLRAPCDHVIHIQPIKLFNTTSKQQLYMISNRRKLYFTNGRNYTSPVRSVEVNVLAENSNGTHQFKLQYKAVHICGTKNLEAKLDEKQHVNQPAQPLGYRSTMSCLYTVRSPPGTKIQFSFPSFGVNTYHSSYFYLKFYDGISNNKNEFLKLSQSTDVNKIYHTSDNVMTFELKVVRGYITYTGFAMFYKAVAIDEFSFINVRVNFTTTYRISVNSTTKARYLLDDFDTVDLSPGVFVQMKNEAKFKSQLVKTEAKESFNGTKIRVRVDLKWTFEMTISQQVISQYRFVTNQVNHVTLTMFSQVRDVVTSSQLVGVDFRMSEVVSGSTLFIVRVDFQFTYKVLLINSLANAYGFEQTIRNEINSEVYKRLSGVASYIQTMKLNKKVVISENRTQVRIDKTRLYNLTLSSTQQNNFKLSQESLNDLSLSVFIQIRRNAEHAQFVGWRAVHVSDKRVMVRVDYTRTYSCLLSKTFIKKYAFVRTTTNDVNLLIFDHLKSKTSFIQLINYQPTAPIPPLLKVAVAFKRTYEVSASKEVKKKFFLSVDEVNEVSETMFAELRLLVNSAQLENTTVSAEGELSESEIHIIVRVDFTATYSVSLQYDGIEEYQCLVNKTNDMSSEIFTNLKDDYLILPELIKRENVTINGTRIKARINGTHQYHVYVSEDMINKYQFTTETTNEFSQSVFTTIRKNIIASQLRKIQTYSAPSGIKIRIRVDFTRVYTCYVSNQVKVNYQFYLKKINDISSSAFITLRKEVSLVELSDIQTRAILPASIKVRVDYNLTYKVYVSSESKVTFKLNADKTNDVSESVFIRVQHQATEFMLTGTTSKDPRTQNKFTVRVDHDKIYEIYLSDDDVRSFPLVAGKVNDITTSIFKQVQKKSITSQLISIDNNPVTVVCRLGSWVYKVIIPDTLRVKYHLSLNQTNDVSNSIFTSLREKSSSVTLVRSQPQNLGNTTQITIRVDSSRTYSVYLKPSDISKFKLATNQTNDITAATYVNITSIARVVILKKVKLSEQGAVCSSKNWTKWFNRDDPSGPCDCETLPELRKNYPGQICEKPTTFQARLENCLIPYDPTLSNIVANVNTGFKCKNENGKKCLDYEVRFCCP